MRPAIIFGFMMVGCVDKPFQEVYDQGLDQYLGGASPSSTVEEGPLTTYSFDPDDGPICLRGDAFNTTTRQGTDRSLVLFLQGGGACWSDLCQAFSTVRPGVPNSGILNTELTVNPVSDWDVGYVPYCDGSLFAGTVDIDDDGDGDIDRYQRGLQNLSASLDVISSQFPEPPRVLVVGSSAGAYGTILGAMLTRKVYPDVPIDVVSDGGLGLGLPGQPWFIEKMLNEWGISQFVPESCENCFEDGHVTGMTSWALERDDQMRVFAISSLQDFIIGQMFLQLSGEDYESAVWSESEELTMAHPEQYFRFLFEGEKHTTVSVDSTIDTEDMEGLPFDFDPEVLARLLGMFDETSVQGVVVSDWFTQGLNNEPGFQSLTP